MTPTPPARLFGLAELHQADQVVRARRERCQDRDLVADLQARFLGGVLVDRDLLLRERTRAFLEVENRELRIGVVREAQGRRTHPGIADGLAVLADDLRVCHLHVAFGRRDARCALHVGEQRRRARSDALRCRSRC